MVNYSNSVREKRESYESYVEYKVLSNNIRIVYRNVGAYVILSQQTENKYTTNIAFLSISKKKFLSFKAYSLVTSRIFF